jgi:hypothetical protein
LTEQTQAEQWHLDKRVPIALIVALVVQTMTVGVWAGAVNQRLHTVEVGVVQQREQNERLVRVEEKLVALSDKLDVRYDEEQRRRGR